MKTGSHIKRDLFNEKIVDLVSDYIENINVYPEYSCLAIQKKSLEVELFTPAEAGPEWETYPIASFIRGNESKDGLEADIDAAFELAGKYYFVR